jgi:uncharacterized protein (DUF3820 family)
MMIEETAEIRHLAGQIIERCDALMSTIPHCAWPECDELNAGLSSIAARAAEICDCVQAPEYSMGEIRTALMASEKKWDRHRALWLADLLMPFGKYAGQNLGSIPLRYLDTTISTMTPTWLVRRVWDLVDLAQEMPSLEEPSAGCSFFARLKIADDSFDAAQKKYGPSA